MFVLIPKVLTKFWLKWLRPIIFMTLFVKVLFSQRIHSLCSHGFYFI